MIEARELKFEKESTPAELNAELKELYDSFPPYFLQDGLSLDEAIELLTTRDESEDIQRISHRLSGLLLKAPITSHMRQYVFSDIVALASLGRQEPIQFPEYPPSYIEYSIPQSTGIFNQASSMRHERVALSLYSMTVLSSLSVRQRLQEAVNFSPTTNSEIKNNAESKIKLWKEEFERIYNVPMID